MFSADLPRNPPEPTPAAAVRSEMRSIMLRHRIVNGVCMCGRAPDATGRCPAARIAHERLALDQRTP